MTTMRKSAVLAAAFVGLCVGSARAEETVVVKVPFAFAVHGQEFPAGRDDVIAQDGLVTIRGIDNREEMYAMTRPAGGSDPAGRLPALVFVRHGAEYQLSQIWETSDDGFVLPDASGSHRSKAKPVASTAPAIVITASEM